MNRLCQLLRQIGSLRDLQASELRRMALYFDAGQELWHPSKPWREAGPEDWDRLFLPSISSRYPGSLVSTTMIWFAVPRASCAQLCIAAAHMLVRLTTSTISPGGCQG